MGKILIIIICLYGLYNPYIETYCDCNSCCSWDRYSGIEAYWRFDKINQ